MSTLVSEPFWEDVPKFLGMSLDELRDRRCPEAFYEFERGQIGELEYADRFFTDDTRLDIEGMKETLKQSVKLLPGTLDTLQALKARAIPMYALSNYSEWYKVIDAATDLSSYLDWKFVSCKTGWRKPEAEAYRNVLNTLKVAPQTCLFVDDRRVNVEAGQKAGMHVLLRTPELDLGQALAQFGLV